MGKNARQIAMEILVRMQRDAAYSNLTLDAALRRNELPARDAALVSALVYGVEERLYTIDYQLSLYLKQPLKKLKPEVLAALRLGVCQLLFMERIPSSAAVCESVSLVKQNGCAFAAGLVNAVLRKVSDAGICLPEQEADALQMLSIRYSFPEWLIEKWLNAYGRENTLSILEACMAPAPLTVRVNTLQTTAEKLTVLLRQDHVAAHAAADVEDALVLDRAGAIERTKAYQDSIPKRGRRRIFPPSFAARPWMPSRGKRFSIFVLRRAAKALPLLSACVGKDRCVPLTCIPPARH